MSNLNLFVAKCAAAVLAASLLAVPALADGYSSGSGSFLTIKSKSVTLHLRSKHPVNRYYAAPKTYHPKPKPKVYSHKGKAKAHHHKTKPRVYYSKPNRRKHRSSFGYYKRRSSPYIVPPLYSTRHRNSHTGFSLYGH